GRVVEERSSTPLAAGETNSHISKSVVHTAIVANVWPPVAGMKEIRTTLKSPVRGRPEQTWFRSRHPRARHPVVAIRAVSPVARSPHIANLRADRLLIHRHHWRSNV